MILRHLWPSILFAASLAFAQAGYVPTPYDVQHYDVVLRMNPADSTIAGSCTMNVYSINDTLHNVRFDLRGLTVDSVILEDTLAKFSVDSASLYVHLPRVTPNLASFVPTIYYHGKPGVPKGETWGGFRWGDSTYVKRDTNYGKGDPTHSIGVAFSDPDVSMTRHWMPCHDLPDDKATVDFTITVPESLVVASNGKLIAVDTAPGWWTYHWHESDPIATYLMTIGIGKFFVQRFLADSIPVEIYTRAIDSAACRTFFTFLDGTLKTFQARFGPYPFNKVGYVLGTLGGGMEHQTMITFGPQFVYNKQYQSTAAHELSHQWWGDMISPFEFKEAWLSEGFASFSEAIYAEQLTKHVFYLGNIRGQMNTYINQTSQAEGVFPLYDFPRNAPSSNYPATIYVKGASVLGMLRWMYGDTTFFYALYLYRQQRQYQSATTRDLQHAFEVATGDTLGWYFDEWVYKAGWPVVRTAVHYGDSIRITLRQVQDKSVAPLFRMPYEVWFRFESGDTMRQRIMMEAVDSQVIVLANPGGSINKWKFDPDARVLGKHVDTVLLSTSVFESEPSPGSIWLEQNFPNPVGRDARTTIHLSPAVYTSRGSMSLKLFDMLGREVRDYTPLLNGYPENVVLDVSDLAAGVYRYALQTAGGKTASKFLVTGGEK